MLTHLRPALSLVGLSTLVLGAVLPVGFVGLGHVLFPVQAGGSLVVSNGRPVGSSLIGQSFTADRDFHGRVSAITGTDPRDPSRTVPTPYDASTSTASNLAPTAAALRDRVAAAMAGLGARPGMTVPMDAVTSSGSGLDPDISPRNASLQVARVAAARHLAPSVVAQAVAQATRPALFGILGAPHVDVLRLNLILDRTRADAAPANTPPTAGPVAQLR